MVTQYITFGQVHRHPETNKPLKNHVVKIVAPSKHMVRAAAFARFGDKFMTNNDNWDKSLYPYGIYETICVTMDCFKGETAPELVSDKVINQHYEETYEEPEEEEKDSTPGEPQGSNRPQSNDYLTGGEEDGN